MGDLTRSFYASSAANVPLLYTLERITTMRLYAGPPLSGISFRYKLSFFSFTVGQEWLITRDSIRSCVPAGQETSSGTSKEELEFEVEFELEFELGTLTGAPNLPRTLP